jgi:hypothetical protein
MDEWLEIREYRDFWDVPQAFVVSLTAGPLVYFYAVFDDGKEDYDRCYTLFSLPRDVDLAGSWIGLEGRAARVLGKIPVSDVRFDPTKRKAIALSAALRELLEAASE